MISQRVRGIYALSILVQLILSQVVFWGLFAVFTAFYSDATFFLSTYVVYSLIASAGILIEALSRRDMDSDWTDKSIYQRHSVALRQALFAAGAIILFAIATKDRIMSRVFLFSHLGLLYVVLLLTTRTLPDFAIKFLFHRLRQQNTLLVGPINKARALNEWLSGKQLLGFKVAGVLSEQAGLCPPELPRLGALEDFQTVVRQKKISHVILVEPPADAGVLSKVISDCEQLGTRLLVVSDLQEKFRHKILYMESGGLQFIGLREEPLENPMNRGLKRGLDVAVAVPTVFAILPAAMALVWVLHRLQSPGPLFYVQERAGFQNNTFKIVKFRTMTVNNSDPAKQATLGDGRIFPAGAWLRKFSIDELPQFWNVLRGQMSVVGPRPHLHVHNEHFSHVLNSYHIRTLVKPGITGLAQVRGYRGEAREEAMILKRIESDIYYLENWSLAADVLIILRTAWRMFAPPKTAY